MYLHKHILYYITFLSIYFPATTPTRNKRLVVTNSGIEEISPCSIGLQFFSVLNNTAEEDYFVELISDECCLHSGESLDCDSVEIIGESSEVIPKGKVKTFTLVAPVIDPFERKGYCVIHVDSRPIGKRNNIMRDIIKIDFDTRIKKKKASTDSEETIKKFKNEDEDPLNDCKPVNCDTYYNGKKPLYDKNTKRCIPVPKCNKKKQSEGNNIYDPLSNRCIDSDPIDNDDIDFIKSLTTERQPKDVIIVESQDQNSIYNSTLMTLNSDLNNLNTDVVHKVKHKYICGSIQRYLTANKYTLLVLGMVIFVQCCLICTMIYCLTKRSICCDKKKVERRYFNYRQDVSVTTPLIGTSNIDTETTGFDYKSESSNIDKKIKCYKACQKERKNDPKMSMSDDILSKCLTRRDWNTKPKSDTDGKNSYNCTNVEWNAKKSAHESIIPEKPNSENVEDAKEIEKQPSEEKYDHKAHKNKDDFGSREIKEDYDENDSSEKLILCHDYNVIQSRRNVIGSEKGEPHRVASMSTEKGAQACFSNDSIDDFLSERGMIFLAGENLSKYSFASNSTPNSTTELSSKTSKNNIVKNVLSYLSRKSKICTSSDPGVKKIKPKGKDLELIHMSRASMYSSSASDYKGSRTAKDSRSSF